MEIIPTILKDVEIWASRGLVLISLKVGLNTSAGPYISVRGPLYNRSNVMTECKILCVFQQLNKARVDVRLRLILSPLRSPPLLPMENPLHCSPRTIVTFYFARRH